MIKISIASTFYNDSEMLKRVLDSVLNQTYTNIEHIITDGGSDDGSVELLKEYEEKYRAAGKVLKWVSEKDKGIYDGANKAFDMTTGDYCVFASDPYVSRETIEYVASVLESKKPDFAYGGVYFQKDGKIIRRWSGNPGNWRLGWMAADPTIFMKHEIWEKYGPYDIKYSSAADYKFQVGLLLDKTLVSCPLNKKIVMFYADGTSNAGFRGKWLSICECRKILKEYNIKFAWFTNLCKTIRAVLAYTFVLHKKIDTEDQG